MASCMLFIGVFAVAMIPARAQDQLNVTSGDVVIGALFEVNVLENGACGEFTAGTLEEVLAVTWFLQSLNARNFVPGITLGLDVSRTCSSTEKAVNSAIRFLNDYNVGDTVKETPLLYGLLGPSRTEEAKAISRLLGSLPPNKRLLQISGSATGSELSDKTLYPNFFRVIPSDSTQVKVLHKLLLQLKWNYVAIAYNDDNYGRPLATELRSLAEETDICVPVFVSLPVDSRSILFETRASDLVNEMNSPSNGLVRGIVIIGSSFTINRLVKKLFDTVKYVNLVVGETVALQQRNLQTTSGQVMSVARGTLVTSPPYFPLLEFRSFWNNLWTNQTLFTEYATRIPWLGSFYTQLTSCDPKQLACWNSKKDIISTLIFEKASGKDVSLYTWYHLKAVAVMASLLKQEQAKRCISSGPGLCPGLKALITDRTSLLDTLRNSNLSLQELGTEISQFANITSLAFDINGELRINQPDNSYTVYNLQQDGGSQYIFKQIATYTNEQLALKTSDAVFYTEGGSPLTWSDRPLAQCDANHDCLQCEKDVANDVVFIEGDVYVVGIVPIHETSTFSSLHCGKIKTLAGADIAESLVFAVKQINKKEGIFKDIFPGRKVGVLLINSCSSPLLIRQRLLDLHTGRLVLPDGSMRNSSVILPYIMGYVGAYASGDSMAAADTLTNIGTPFVQISAASTSPVLKDRSVYPYFMRVVSPDNIQAQIMLDVAVKLNATYIQIVYDKTIAYARAFVQAIEDAVKSNYAKVCIAQKIAITPVDEVSEYKWIKDELRKKSAARLVIVVLYPAEIAKLTDAILPELTVNDNFLFLASESWGRRQPLIEGKTKLEGSLVLSQEIPIDLSFDAYFRSLDPTQTENIWLRNFWETRKSCYFDKSFERKGKTGMCPDNVAADYVDDPRASLHIQAMYALVIGVNQTLSRLCGPAARSMCDAVHSDDLVKTLKTVKLDLYNTGERTQVFDDNGDGLVGFKILQVTRDRTVSDNTMVYKEVGSWAHQTLSLDEKELSPLSRQIFLSTCPNQVECDVCFAQEVSTARTSNVQDINAAAIGVGVAFAVVVFILLVALLCMCLLYRRKAKSQHKSATILEARTRPQFTTPSEFVNKDIDNETSDVYHSLHPEDDRSHAAQTEMHSQPSCCTPGKRFTHAGYITPVNGHRLPPSPLPQEQLF